MGFSRQEYWSGVPLPSPFLIISGESHRVANVRMSDFLTLRESPWEAVQTDVLKAEVQAARQSAGDH